MQEYIREMVTTEDHNLVQSRATAKSVSDGESSITGVAPQV